MLRVLRPTRTQIVGHSRRPTARCLRFYPTARSARKFTKKITHPYPFRFLLPCRSALLLPRPERGRAIPSLLPHAPSVATRLPSSRAPLAPSRVTCAGAGGVRSARHPRRPPSRAKPGAGGAHACH
jgi:hypothetical protein